MSAMGLRKRGATIVGFEGTSGSVSCSNGEMLMPHLELSFTLGQSLDEEKNIQLEANAQQQGGVLPDAPIPRSVANIHGAMQWQLNQLTQGQMESDAIDIELRFAKELISSQPVEADVWLEPAPVEQTSAQSAADAAALALLAELELEDTKKAQCEENVNTAAGRDKHKIKKKKKR